MKNPLFSLKSLWHYAFRKPKAGNLQELLNSYNQLNKSVSFIQIGSNDGLTGDPLNKHIIENNWSGILIEPVPYLFKKLTSNYRQFQNQLKFENVAISHQDGFQAFYRLKEVEGSDLPKFYDQLGSFSKETILSHRSMIPKLDDLLIEDNVITITFETLLKKHNKKTIDLIHIDTEGHDAKIVKQINFENLKCEIIIFEHKHLKALEYGDCLALLRRNSYDLFTCENDTIGVSRKVSEKLKI